MDAQPRGPLGDAEDRRVSCRLHQLAHLGVRRADQFVVKGRGAGKKKEADARPVPLGQRVPEDPLLLLQGQQKPVRRALRNAGYLFHITDRQGRPGRTQGLHDRRYLDGSVHFSPCPFSCAIHQPLEKWDIMSHFYHQESILSIRLCRSVFCHSEERASSPRNLEFDSACLKSEDLAFAQMTSFIIPNDRSDRAASQEGEDPWAVFVCLPEERVWATKDPLLIPGFKNRDPRVRSG